jgi:hypothetical protein
VDAFLHFLLGAAFGAIAAAMFALLPTPIVFAALGSLYVFLREVDQEQAKHHDFDFRKGWDFWNWSRDKLLETFLPIAVLMGLGFHFYFWGAM